MGRLARHPIGACVGSAFDASRLDAVSFFDVGEVIGALDAFALPSALVIAVDP